MRKFIGVAATLAIATGGIAQFSTASHAADMMPVKAAPKAVSSSGLYVWADGSYQSINLPSYALGYRTTVFPSVAFAGYANTFDPRATGYGLSGGVGYLFGDHVWPAWMGRNARVEISGSYVQAIDKQNGIGPTALEFGQQALGGFTGGNVLCPQLCYSSARLQTDYDSWRINARIAGDHMVNGVLVTPSFALFGGRTNVDQQFQQSLINLALGPQPNDYIANSSLYWTDLGAKAGLDTITPLGQSGWALGLNGNVGVAYRDVSLSANNLANNAALPASSLNVDSDKAAFVANAETSLIYKPSALVSLRAFVGLNFDSAVPGINGPTPPPTFIANVQATPGGIKYESETSYYAGGGVTVKFAP